MWIETPGIASVIQKNHKTLGFVTKPWVLLAKPWVSHKTLSFGSKTLGFMSKPRVLLAKPRVLWQNPGFCNWKPRVLFGKPWVLWIIGQNNFHTLWQMIWSSTMLEFSRFFPLFSRFFPSFARFSLSFSPFLAIFSLSRGTLPPLIPVATLAKVWEWY